LSLLSKVEVYKQLKLLDGWSLNNNTIKKEYIFDSYMDSIRFINLLAKKAEENNHHPDLVVGWCKINMVLTSHDFGGVTQLCIRLAQEAEKIFSGKDFS
tara:strand:+ start:453 stop:749 length:297 start_codon:yes stop_codon:yes gene_type:complete